MCKTHQEIINIKSLTKKFDEKIIIDNLSLNIYKGEAITLIGQSGTGKTTLLKIISGIYNFDDGEIHLFGIDLKKATREEHRWINSKTGFLFQNYALFDSMNILENIIFYLIYHKKLNYEESKNRAEFLLSIVGLENISTKYPS
ncbi:MAG: ATP-binding cassette domain-containing protein, partial [bacterium]